MEHHLLHIWCLLLVNWNHCNSVSDAAGRKEQHHSILENLLLYYEVLEPTHFEHRVMRRSADQQDHVRHIKFNALGRRFFLDLKQSRDIFSSDFQALEVQSDGTEKKKVFDTGAFYSGYLHLEYDTSAHFHVDEKGVLSGSIQTPHDVYHIEPLHFHSPDTQNTEQMIVYRESHVKQKQGLHVVNYDKDHAKYHEFSFLDDNFEEKQNRKQDFERRNTQELKEFRTRDDSVKREPSDNKNYIKQRQYSAQSPNEHYGLSQNQHPEPASNPDSLSTTHYLIKNRQRKNKQTEKQDFKLTPINVHSKQSKRRTRRSTKCSFPPKVCELYLVADYLYYENVGGSNFESTIRYMVQAITESDKIFKNTDWSSDGGTCFNLRFSVKAVKIYKHPSNESGPAFNQPSNAENTKNLQMLRYFQNDEPKIKNETICLSHLFTYRDFPGGVVGLAFIRSKDGSVGICSSKKVSLSSSLNFKRRLLTMEANLVTAHELAHNFGANHDSSSKCTPGKTNRDLGNYLMYDRLLPGDKENNRKLSVCSINDILRLLINPGTSCLVDYKGSICGNGITEDTTKEECDGGIITEQDPCCTSNCRLKNKYECSDRNHACCTNCFFSSNNTICRKKNKCNDIVYCSGRSGECPRIQKPLDDNSPCDFKLGNCRNGKCVNICTQNKLQSCQCMNEKSCYVCCKNETGDNRCEVLLVNGTHRKQPDGRWCSLNHNDDNGLCFNGECQKRQKEVRDEFSDLLKDFSFSKLGRLLKANIVGTILTFSLLVWVPASCIVHYLDKQQDEQDYMFSRWMNPNSDQLLSKETTKKIKALFKKSPKHVSGAKFHISS